MPDISLGLSFGTHDTAAALAIDGVIVFAVEEERLTRNKRESAFPRNAVEMTLRESNICVDDLSNIAVGMSPAWLLLSLAQCSGDSASNHRLEQAKYVLGTSLSLLRIKRYLTQIDRKFATKPVLFYRHHLAHAASAYFSTDQDSAVVIVVDGVGEHDCVSWYEGKGANLHRISSAPFPNSLGKFYGAISRYLGFSGTSKEGHTMALAAEGTGRLVSKMNAIFRFEGTRPLIDQTYWAFGMSPKYPSLVSSRFELEFGPRRKPMEPLQPHHLDIAYAAQRALENCLIEIVGGGSIAHRARNLCLAGGVALNCAANARVSRELGLNSVFVPPWPNDSGLAIGAAILASQKGHAGSSTASGRSKGNPFLGAEPRLAPEDVHCGELFQVDQIGNPIELAARLLAQGEVIGWCRGRAEFGPRALGNRSILADPRSLAGAQFISRHIKTREPFRPYAPAVLSEHLNTIFESIGVCVAHMSAATRVISEWQHRIPAVVHVDGTARVQSVTRQGNPVLHQLLLEFLALTGIPVLLNTSLNRDSEPMAYTAKDAIRLFVETPLRHLFVDNFYFKKRD